MRFLLAILALLVAAPVASQDVVAALSINRVSITASFDGSEVILFGAVKHDTPSDASNPFGVIVTLTGPSTPIVVRRKAKVAGIWVNKDAVEVDSAPVYYSIAASDAYSNVISQVEDLRYKISIDQAIRSVGAPMEIMDSASFTEALIRIRERSGQYHLNEDSVIIRDNTLFRTRFVLPANLTEGTYTANIYLTQDKKVIAQDQGTIKVQKAGIGAWIYNLAHNQPLIYALLSLAIAIAAGWGASAVFRVLRF